MALMFVGLGFKVAAAPFHVWTPDVYEGAPAPIVGFMSTAPKAAAFAVLLRVVFTINAPGRFWLLWVAAGLSMTLGNVGALVQTNVKRLLAYSSIAHAGYLLVAFAITGADNSVAGISAAMFYTASYAATLTIFLLSLIGIPMTGGFFAKFYVFSAAMRANLIWLTLVGVVNSAIGAYYYLRIVVVMYMRESRKQIAVTPVPAGLGLALAISVAATLYLGILPSRVLQYTEQSAQELLPPSPASIVSNTLQKQPPAGIPGR
jgi:NADH-quinone oxidoreductase subunit N